MSHRHALPIAVSWLRHACVDAQGNTDLAPSSGLAAAAGKDEGPPLLAVDPRKLRADEEMQRIFGSRLMRAEERENAAGGVPKARLGTLAI